jgi:hypothetical protein
MTAKFECRKAYANGLVGWRASPRADELLADQLIRAGGDPDGGRVMRYWELTGAGADKLTILFPTVEKVFPGCWPGPPQLWGDCVSKGVANSLLTSIATEIADGRPDPDTGIVEAAPELSEEGIANSVIASESIFAWRGYDGDGWIGSEAAAVAVNKGFLVRQNYPELKIDLTKYTNDTIRVGGRTAPGKKWLEESTKHRARTATFLKGREQVRDFLASGYGIFNTSSLGFVGKRDENGFSNQRGTWQHSQVFIGYDDRPATKKKYGQALVLWLNSWGKWNDGGRTILGTDIQIPHGSYWALASTIDQCNCWALSNVSGWPRRKIPSYGGKGRI